MELRNESAPAPKEFENREEESGEYFLHTEQLPQGSGPVAEGGALPRSSWGR